MDEASLDMVTDTEPAVECDSSAHINIGEHFQVTCIPNCDPNGYQESKEDVHERLLWDANLIKDAADESKGNFIISIHVSPLGNVREIEGPLECVLFSVNMFLDFACCAAIPGGGRNKEYALHVLQLCEGKIHVSRFHSLLRWHSSQNDGIDEFITRELGNSLYPNGRWTFIRNYWLKRYSHTRRTASLSEIN